MLLERLARELVGAGTDRLDEAQPLRARQEIVAPEPRDHQHVGVTDPLLERGAVAHVEALDAGRELKEALAQPIGDMRETDRQLALDGSMRHLGIRWLCRGFTQDNEPNAGLPSKRRIEFQVGIHLGDVVKESDGPDGRWRQHHSAVGGYR